MSKSATCRWLRFCPSAGERRSVIARVVCAGLTRGAPISDLVRRFYRDVWNRWDDEAVDQLLAQDLVFRGSLGDEERGRDGFRAYRDRVRAAFPDFRSEIIELIADGERAAVHLRFSGSHRGELFATAPTGRSVVYEAAAFLRSRDNQLCEVWVLGDLDGLWAQLRERGQLLAQTSDRSSCTPSKRQPATP